MKKILLSLLFLPLLVVGQFTYIPDDNFEQELIDLGYDFILDDNVETMAIDTIKSLYINGLGIADLTGIEAFTSLKDLFCYSHLSLKEVWFSLSWSCICLQLKLLNSLIEYF
jgi:hypothetical protein